MADTSERRVEVRGVETFVRVREGDGTPVVLLHGVPNDSSMWDPFVAALDAPTIAPDLPGFGNSERPDRNRFDCTIESYAAWVDEFLEAFQLERCSLLLHDWGAIALPAAIARPDRVERLVMINAVPLGCDYPWHPVARIWRTPVLGELFNAAALRPLAAWIPTRRGPYAGIPREFLDSWWPHFNRGTKRAILSLYRSADPERLDRAGAGMEALEGPVLVLAAAGDPYIPPRYAARLAGRLPNAELVEYEGAGHWPWLERPEVIERATAFLSAR